MTKTLLSAVAAFAVGGALFAATTQSKSTKKRSHPKPTASQTSARTTAKSTKAKPKSKKTPARTARSYQQAPTPERYQEIQQALAAKGYFQGQANGQWGPDSVDALKRFQTDQNLMPDGKINSLSLIAMGLGPKRLTAQSKPATPPNPATPIPATPANPAPAATAPPAVVAQ